ncbi:hypothetical protein LT679_06595 [Mucilaginibacter roseus]|uniref:Fimbrillin family protein n=1 Tax=Mucilaginibacter roseus TaxID=1528868 RepID=A0ABS8U3X0_9SPHI|nr:hypothetical protein [Mucilaginibacter roseus]MCD8740266.1 hypothetical protein [Mucilaginibacter roseus]
MKKPLLLCSVLALLLFACKKGSKDTPPPTDEKKYAVTFNVSDFSQDYGPLESAKQKKGLKLNADSSSTERLVYQLFKEGGTGFIAYKNLLRGDAGFGTFSEQLTPGNYIAAFVGSSKYLQNSGDKKTFTYLGPWGEIFTKRVSFTVSSAPVNTSVQLDRVNNQLVLNIEDAIPADVKKIEFSYTDNFALNVTASGNGFTNANTRTVTVYVTSAEVGKTNYKIAVNTCYNAASTVTIRYFKNDPNVPYGIKTVPNVIRKTNYRTTVSGKLFTPGNAGFTVDLDDTWDEPVNGEF